MSVEKTYKNGEDSHRPDRDRVSAVPLRADPIESAVAAMAEDPQVQAECAAIARDFATTDMDGLGND